MLNKVLYPAQHDTYLALADKLSRMKGVVCRADEGTGKTIIATAVAQGRDNILWVAPAKALKGLKKKVEQYQVKYKIAHQDTFTFISYHAFADVTKYSARDLSDFDFVVFDESHALRNWKAGWTQRFVKTKFPKYLFLTATPMVKTPRDYIYIMRKCGLFKGQTTKDFDIHYFDAKPSKFGDWLERGEFQNKECFQTNLDKICVELTHKDLDSNIPPINLNFISLPGKYVEPADITLETKTRVAAGATKVKNAAKEIRKIWRDNEIHTSLVYCAFHENAKAMAKELGAPLALTADKVYKEFERIAEKGGHLVTTLGLTDCNLDLNECDNVFMVESTYSYSTDRQSIRRCQRLGKENPVNVYYFTLDGEHSVIKSFSRKFLTERLDNAKNIRPSELAILEDCPGSFWITPEEAKADYIQKAALRGTENHLFVERYLDNPKLKLSKALPKEVLPMIDYCRTLIKDVQKEKGKTYGSESRVSAPSIHERFKGTVDFWAYSRDRKTLVICDYKNGSSPVKAEDNLQLLAYSVLVCETFMLKPEKVVNIIYQRDKKKQVVYKGDIISATRKRISTIVDKVLKAEENPLAHIAKGDCHFFCNAAKYHKENNNE